MIYAYINQIAAVFFPATPPKKLRHYQPNNPHNRNHSIDTNLSLVQKPLKQQYLLI
jgi:hypothetical protein